MGQILTFYSYKGGVGRTMALANIAVLLAQKGKKVLIVDWDLEAPGLEYYFKDYLDMQKTAFVPGVIDLIYGFVYKDSDSRDLKWQDCLVSFRVLNSKLSLITSGRKKPNEAGSSYFTLVRNLDVDHFYDEKRGGNYIERLRNEWKEEFDYVLIDSRTGITDIGGICTIQFPDALVLLFNSNEQNLAGVVEVAKKVNDERKKLPFDRYSLIVYPIASRFDSQAEFKISQEWLGRIATSLKDFFSNWLPKNIDIRSFIEVTKIPYSPYFSFGEKLPVIEQGLVDPTGLGFAFETIASIIANKFENVENVLRSRGLAGFEITTTENSLQKIRNLIMLLVSLLALASAMIGGAKLAYDVLGPSFEDQPSLLAAVIALGISYAIGWLTAMIAIRVYGNLILPILINLFMWICLIGICYLYVEILIRLYQQQYDFWRFLKYVFVMLAGLAVLVGLHLVIEDHNLRPFSIPLLFTSLIHLGLIVFRYVFIGGSFNYILYDLFFLFGMSAFSILMLAHVGLLDPLRTRLTNYFDRNSTSIRTQY